jgi:hypothetical protein
MIRSKSDQGKERNKNKVRGKIMQRNLLTLIFFVMSLLVGSNSVSAQFKLPIKINKPDIRIDKPDIRIDKPNNIKTNNDTSKESNNKQNVQIKNVKSNSDHIYTTPRPTGTPLFIKSSLDIKTTVINEYWKMKGQSDFSSWVPKIRFNQYYNNEKPLIYTVDYFSPDGSAWFSETLESQGRNADRTVLYQSPSPFENNIIHTKSTNGTGVYSFKVTNQETKEVLIQGKFKVGKFSRAYRDSEKNKFDFFVDNDWVMPYATIAFHHSLDEKGAMPPQVSVWLKGDIDRDQLEGRVFYQGRQIASTKDDDGASGAGIVEERGSEYMPAFRGDDYLRRWQFVWGNLRFDNNGDFNRDYFPKAHYADKNPGDYTIKIYRNGTQIREFGFTIGADGRMVPPAYSNQVFLPYYGLVLPVKVMGTGEKWNAAAWKTDSFYGNPINGFTIQ